MQRNHRRRERLWHPRNGCGGSLAKCCDPADIRHVLLDTEPERAALAAESPSEHYRLRVPAS